jgi:hypothetical protein
MKGQWSHKDVREEGRLGWSSFIANSATGHIKRGQRSCKARVTNFTTGCAKLGWQLSQSENWKRTLGWSSFITGFATEPLGGMAVICSW